MTPRALRIGQPGRMALLSGNEAIARGALEAGVAYAASYPGSPSAEVLSALAEVAEEFNRHAEWSTNEKVAMEGAAAASFAGLRSMVVMKPDGLNVAYDFLTSLSLSGSKGGMVIVVADDPAAHSSLKEEDSRALAKAAEIPLLEPADFQDALEMTRWAFGLSEQIKLPVMIRSVTRLSHARGNVVLGPLSGNSRRAAFDEGDRFITVALLHGFLHQKNAAARAAFEGSPFNAYLGPDDASFLVVASGPGFLYAREAVELLGLGDEVGIVKLGTTWPLPADFLRHHLRHAREILFVEEVDPFLEESIQALAAGSWKDLTAIEFYGKRSGHLAGPMGPATGEVNVDLVLSALARLKGRTDRPRSEEHGMLARQAAGGTLPNRDLAFCAWCPHRASFWAIKSALEIDARKGIVLGDIGCYSMGAMRTGHYLLRTMHAMGSGVGLASGFGKLNRFGFDQPVVAIVGDSTFYHATLPALINARYNQSDFLLVVLDNGTTAMTGHQPHPGTGVSAVGQPGTRVTIEQVAQALDIPVVVRDPFAVQETVKAVFELLQQDGVKILILRRLCALIEARTRPNARIEVDPDRCIGENCGCNRFCSRVFSCPGIYWDAKTGTAAVDEAVCTRCGVCVDLCPRGAIQVKEEEPAWPQRAL